VGQKCLVQPRRIEKRKFWEGWKIILKGLRDRPICTFTFIRKRGVKNGDGVWETVGRAANSRGTGGRILTVKGKVREKGRKEGGLQRISDVVKNRGEKWKLHPMGTVRKRIQRTKNVRGGEPAEDQLQRNSKKRIFGGRRR